MKYHRNVCEGKLTGKSKCTRSASFMILFRYLNPNTQVWWQSEHYPWVWYPSTTGSQILKELTHIQRYRDGSWLICTAGFITSFLNYRVKEQTGKNPIYVYLQPKPLSSEKGEKKKTKQKHTGIKHFGAFKRGLTISITSEDKCKIFCTFVSTAPLCREEGTTWKSFIS